MESSGIQLSDFQVLFYLRWKVKRQITNNEKVKFSGSINISELRKLKKEVEDFMKQQQIIGEMGERQLRSYLMDEISDDTKIRQTTTGNSVIDLLCKYLGYADGFEQFKQDNAPEILKVVAKTKKVYNFERFNDFIPEQSKQYFLIDYYSSIGMYLKGIVTLNLIDKSAGLIVQHPNYQNPNINLEYTGYYDLEPSGFLNVYLGSQLNDRPIKMVIKVFLDDPSKTTLKYFIGIYVTTAAYVGMNMGGFFLGTRYLDYEECYKAYQLPIEDEDLKALLKQQSIRTPLRAFQDLSLLIKDTKIENGVG